MEKQKTLVLTSCLLLSLCSCVNSDIRKNLSQMLDHKIVIPYEQLEKRDCSYFRDSVKEGRTLTFVVYIDGNQCAPCELSDLSFMDRHYRNDTLWQKGQADLCVPNISMQPYMVCQVVLPLLVCCPDVREMLSKALWLESLCQWYISSLLWARYT